MLLEQIAQPVAVDEIDRRGAVPVGFGARVLGERSGGDEQTLLAPPTIAARNSRTTSAPAFSGARRKRKNTEKLSSDTRRTPVPST